MKLKTSVFGKQKKTFFTDKAKNSNNIILTENYQTIRENEKIFKISIIIFIICHQMLQASTSR